jgi:hypothetical protein
MGLSALSRNFFSSFKRNPEARHLPILAPWSRRMAAATAPFRSLRRRPKKERKRNESFAKRNERFRTTTRKSLKTLAAKCSHFAGLFVFNDLTAVSFRSLPAIVG